MSSGGARSGAGRKPFRDGARRVRVAFRVDPLTAQIISRMRESGMHVSKEVDDMFLELAISMGWIARDDDEDTVRWNDN